MGNIKELRERYQLTRKQFAELLHIPLRTVQSWELGDRACPVYVFRMIEVLLGFYQRSGALERFREGNK
jgi:DNA-binding transcriptional regulator YiaG